MSGTKVWGEIRVIRSNDCVVENSMGRLVTCTHSLIEWIPPDEIADNLPVGFSIRFDCYEKDGVRRFLPSQSQWAVLVEYCHIVGTIIRFMNDNLSSESAHGIQNQRFCSRWMMARQDFSKRKFNYSSDFHVVKSSRDLPKEHSCTVDFSYLDPNLERIGLIRERSQNDNPRKRFHDGLFEITKQWSVHQITSKPPSRIVRDAFLVHRKEQQEVTPDQLDEVLERVDRQIQKQSDLDSAQFSKWQTSSKTNLPTVISRMSGQLKLTRDQTNACLFELGWHGLKQSAFNVDTTMQYIGNTIGNLNETERRMFDSLYRCCSELDSLPLVLLLERHEFVEPACLEIWNRTDINDVVPQVLIMLHFYGMMVRHRRKSDRIGKSKKTKATRKSNRIENSEKKEAGNIVHTVQIADGLEFIEDATIEYQPGSSFELRDYVIEKLGLKCAACGSSDLDLEIEPQPEADSFEFSGRCNTSKTAFRGLGFETAIR